MIDRQYAETLPLNGRTGQSPLELTPGVIFTRVGPQPVNTGLLSVNGQRPNANYFTVDGVSANAGINRDESATVTGSEAGAPDPTSASGNSTSSTPQDDARLA